MAHLDRFAEKLREGLGWLIEVDGAGKFRQAVWKCSKQSSAEGQQAEGRTGPGSRRVFAAGLRSPSPANLGMEPDRTGLGAEALRWRRERGPQGVRGTAIAHACRTSGRPSFGRGVPNDREAWWRSQKQRPGGDLDWRTRAVSECAHARCQGVAAAQMTRHGQC